MKTEKVFGIAEFILGIVMCLMLSTVVYCIWQSVKPYEIKPETKLHEYQQPLCPRSEQGIVHISKYSYSISKDFDMKPKPGLSYQENEFEKSIDLFKMIECINGELFLNTEQVINPNSKYKTKFWIAASPKVCLLLCRHLYLRDYDKYAFYQSHAPFSYGYYKSSSDSPSEVEIFRTDFLTDKIVVGLIDYRVSFASSPKNSWHISYRYGGEKYYGIINLKNFKTESSY